MEGARQGRRRLCAPCLRDGSRPGPPRGGVPATAGPRLKHPRDGIAPSRVRHLRVCSILPGFAGLSLPVTTREDLRRPDALLAGGYARRRLRLSMTSGSTGRRTTSYFDEPAWVLAKNLLKLRARPAGLHHPPADRGDPAGAAGVRTDRALWLRRLLRKARARGRRKPAAAA